MDLSQLNIPSGANLTLVEVQQGGTNIQHVEHYHNRETVDEPFAQAYALLDKLINELIGRGKADAKSVLLPYVAAVKASAVPKMSLDEFNQRYRLKLTSSGFSDYVGMNSRFLDTDLEPYIRLFLKCENTGSGTCK